MMLVRVLVRVLSVAVLSCGAAPTETSGNFVSNGGFEASLAGDRYPTGFIVGPVDSRTTANGTFRLVSDVRSGKNALEIIRTNTASGFALTVQLPPIEATSRVRRFAVVCWVKPVKGPEGGRGARLWPQAFTPEWTGACSTLQSVSPNPYLGRWCKQAVLLELHKDKALGHFRLRVDAHVPGDGVLIDDVMFVEVSDWPANKTAALLAPETAALAPGQIDKLPFRSGNILENSSFELGLARGWSILGLLPEEQRAAADRTTARHGDQSLRLEFKAKSTTSLVHKFMPVRPYQTHTLSAWVRAEQPGSRVTLRFENGYVPDGSPPHRAESTVELPEGVWKRISVSGYAEEGPANAYAVRISARGTGHGKVFIDAVQFEEGTEPRPYAPRHVVEAALIPDRPEAISAWDAPLRYSVHVFNGGTASARGCLRLDISDFWGQSVLVETNEEQDFPPGLTSLNQKKTAPARGSLRARLWMDAREKPEDEVIFTVVPDPRYPERHPASRFGQHVRLEPWQLGIAKRLGACWVRLHDSSKALSWDYVQPEREQWVWADDQIDAAHDAGLEVLAVWGRTPQWASGVTGKGSYRSWMHYPANLEEWRQYVAKVTAHYAGRVDTWEIWNEPWGDGFGDFDGGAYAKLSQVAFEAAKEANPDCTVLGLCTWDGARLFNRDALAGGALEACDIASYHCYTRTGVDAYRRAMRVRETLGLDEEEKSFWMSEGIGGYTSTWHSQLLDAVDDPYSRRPAAPILTSEAAAVNGAIAMAGMLSAGVEKVFWYWSPWEGSGSIRPDRYTWFEYDGQLKPYAAMYAVCAHFLDGMTAVKRDVSRDHLVTCLFECSERAVAVTWWEGDGEVDLRVGAAECEGFGVFDFMGNAQILKNGTIRVGAAPLYFLWEGRPGKALWKALKRK